MRENIKLIAIVITTAGRATTAHGGFFYACREGIDQYEPIFTAIEVTFRPYFSNKTPWVGTVEVVGEGRSVPISAGEFTDTFEPEVVHIYKFLRPAPYAAE